MGMFVYECEDLPLLVRDGMEAGHVHACADIDFGHDGWIIRSVGLMSSTEWVDRRLLIQFRYLDPRNPDEVYLDHLLRAAFNRRSDKINVQWERELQKHDGYLSGWACRGDLAPKVL